MSIATAEIVLVADNLQLSFAHKPVVNNVSLSLHRQEFVGLIGPNGAGKSSLLRLLAGLQHPDNGELRFASPTLIPMTKIPPRQRAKRLAYLAQHEQPAWPLHVRHLVALGRSPWQAGLGGQLQPADEQAITKAMAMAEVTALANRPVTELSGGEVQRVLLARVFAGEPEIIVADEPIVALDVNHQLQMMELLQRHALLGGTVIAALHDLGLAARFCTRLILMHKGQVIADGEPIQVLTPENLARVYGIRAYVDCRDDGVVIIPRDRIVASAAD